ncbi:hypothetical protein Tco_1313074 [Tanacetum coccineum]
MAAIKTRFGGNANSKKMQKAVLKQQFEAFTISSKESLEKGYDRFQKLLSQLDALGAGVSDEDANHKFLRSLPPAWDSLAMTMRTKKNIDTLSIDDLYNNLSVFEQDIQKTSSSSLASDNVAFLSQAKASSSKHKPSHSSGSYSSYTTSSSKATPTATPGLADEVIHSFLATNADDVDLIHEDLDQIDDLDLEEMDINWQIAMTAIKIKKFYKKTGRRPRVDGKIVRSIGLEQTKMRNSISSMAFTVIMRKPMQDRGTRDIDDTLYEYGIYGLTVNLLGPIESDAMDVLGLEWNRRQSEDYHVRYKCGICLLLEEVKLPSSKGYTVISKSSSDEAKMWHMRRKAHKAPVRPRLTGFDPPSYHTLHMDLFGPTLVRSNNPCKLLSSGLLMTVQGFVGVMLEFCGDKGIKQEFSNAKTPQQNGSKEVLDIDVQTEEAAELMVVSSTSLKEATRTAVVSTKSATKKTPSLKKPSSTPISKSADDIMTFRQELDALVFEQ